jgi:hypothetical protein
MAQPPKQSASSAKGGGGRRRTPAPPVKKPFPWGVVATSAVLGALLIGILVYAVTNQGAGFVTALVRADKSVDDVKVFKDLKRNHVEGAVKYDDLPPAGGPHNNVPQTCQVYPAAIPDEHAVHSLEHGAVWITYKPDLAQAEVAKLAGLVEGNEYRMLSPYPGLKSPITLQAWGRQISVDSADDKRVQQFLDAYTGGPQAPERGSACGGTTATGTLASQPVPTAVPSAAATAAPSSAGSAAPSPAASAK